MSSLEASPCCLLQRFNDLVFQSACMMDSFYLHSIQIPNKQLPHEWTPEGSAFELAHIYVIEATTKIGRYNTEQVFQNASSTAISKECPTEAVKWEWILLLQVYYIYIYQDSNLSKSWSISKTVIFWLWSGGWGGVLMRECVLWSSLVRLWWCLLRTARIGVSIFTRIPSLLLISGGTSALFQKLSAILSWSPILESLLITEEAEGIGHLTGRSSSCGSNGCSTGQNSSSSNSCSIALTPLLCLSSINITCFSFLSYK